MIEVEGLGHRYGDRTALDGVSFTVAAGERFAILGPNGGGKSTLLAVLATLLAPQTGRVRVAGCSLPGERNRARRRLGVVFQAPALDNLLTVRENLHHHGRLYGLGGGVLRRGIDEQLELLDLVERAGDRVSTLSGGLARRVELAKALLPDPDLLLLDEPTTGLDPLARRRFYELLHDLRDRRGLTVVHSTHLLDEAEQSDRLLLLDRGRVVASGPPGELVSAVGREVVEAGVGDPEDFAQRVAARLGLRGEVLEGRVLFTADGGAELLAQLATAFPGEAGELVLRRPNLEDVFRARTGHSWAARQQGTGP